MLAKWFANEIQYIKWIANRIATHILNMFVIANWFAYKFLNKFRVAKWFSNEIGIFHNSEALRYHEIHFVPVTKPFPKLYPLKV